MRSGLTDKTLDHIKSIQPMKSDNNPSRDSVKTHKICPSCNRQRELTDFIAAYGHKNPKGKYCSACYQKREEENTRMILLRERAYTLYLQDTHCKDWRMFALPHFMEYTLFLERTNCPYCGRPLGPKEDRAPNGKVRSKHNHIDHMDPLYRGGEDSIRNAIYCCSPCNLKKGDMLFVDWLETIPIENTLNARELYKERHQGYPEDFVPGKPTDRISKAGTGIILPNDYYIRALELAQ